MQWQSKVLGESIFNGFDMWLWHGIVIKIPMDIITLIRWIFGLMLMLTWHIANFLCLFIHRNYILCWYNDDQQKHFIFENLKFSNRDGTLTTIAPWECNLNFLWICKWFVECITITKSCLFSFYIFLPWSKDANSSEHYKWFNFIYPVFF